MAFFKFRKGEGNSVPKPTQSESVEAMRRRARQRLIGAGVLVLAGIIGFPLLFDTQPRPVAVDIPIEIPDRHKSGSLAMASAEPALTLAAATPAAVSGAADKSGAPVAESGAAASARAAATAPRPGAAQPESKAAAVASTKPETKPETKLEPKPEPKVVSNPEPKAESKPDPQLQAATKKRPAAASGDEAARARALLEGRAVVASAAADDRFVVQVGAFAEAGTVREVRQKLERAGVKTYVQVAQTKEGPRIRVRVGPFTSRADADRAAQKIKGLELPAAILTL